MISEAVVTKKKNPPHVENTAFLVTDAKKKLIDGLRTRLQSNFFELTLASGGRGAGWSEPDGRRRPRTNSHPNLAESPNDGEGDPSQGRRRGPPPVRYPPAAWHLPNGRLCGV